MEIVTKYFTEFSDKQLQQLEQLKTLYTDWNEKINVISRKDIESLYEKHVLHSLSIAAVFELNDGAKVLDLGTGGGFPGIPLAIFFPEVSFHLVDSIAKKLKVVQAIADELGLTNVTTQHTRVEDIKNRKFDYVVSRAVAPLKDLWQWCRPLITTQPAVPLNHAPGLICLKGGDLNIEIQDSQTKPKVIDITGLYSEDYFKEKYILYVTR
jgi:16S rRNA (guanine527-N7)-methyltransferase